MDFSESRLILSSLAATPLEVKLESCCKERNRQFEVLIGKWSVVGGWLKSQSKKEEFSGEKLMSWIPQLRAQSVICFLNLSKATGKDISANLFWISKKIKSVLIHTALGSSSLQLSQFQRKDWFFFNSMPPSRSSKARRVSSILLPYLGKTIMTRRGINL